MSAPAKRNRKKYASDAEIERLVRASVKIGVNPHSLTFHADGSVTVSDLPAAHAAHTTEPRATAYERSKALQEAKNRKNQEGAR